MRLRQFSGAVALAALWRPWDWRLSALVLATVAALYLPYLGAGWGVLGFLPGYFADEQLTTGEGIRWLRQLQSLTGPIARGPALYLFAAATAMAILSLRVAFRNDRSKPATLAAIGLLLTAFLVLVSPHYPWYFLVLVPFLAICPSATAWTLTVGSVVLYDVAQPDRWLPVYNVREAMFTILTLAALGIDFAVLRSRSNTTKPGAIPT